MKQKLIALAQPLLIACLGFAGWVGSDVVSVFFLGEYSYPTEEE